MNDRPVRKPDSVGYKIFCIFLGLGILVSFLSWKSWAAYVLPFFTTNAWRSISVPVVIIILIALFLMSTRKKSL
ncbi:MAG: hypothetical protein UT24_C0007G0038 [Candidatus Woesebacteria bacterium GW2011_GWB1_39_12]|uniref:Uncharacterized protein n=1 Tax=Candidatus Woesebacteria bacterium GW2011_GWB1_39_12 TaxID=1618574 RepID=A0A0G0PSD0_9BACT|nr:MAG: hypothetical protein UT24_C0007G0038 [Candidatus Woesebacteria bacterium GW2011_GWB1_39_12]